MPKQEQKASHHTQVTSLLCSKIIISGVQRVIHQALISITDDWPTLGLIVDCFCTLCVPWPYRVLADLTFFFFKVNNFLSVSDPFYN